MFYSKPKEWTQHLVKTREKTTAVYAINTPTTFNLQSLQLLDQREDALGKHLFSLGESATADCKEKEHNSSLSEEEKKHGDADTLKVEETG